MTIIHNIRPFNTRYVIRERSTRYTPELLRTHRTAQASYAYVNRQNSVDEWGPTPNWASRSDLAAAGRCAPARAAGPKPVSYTHLDVYKRQDRDRPAAICHGGGYVPNLQLSS